VSGESKWGLLFLWSLCVFLYIFVVVEEGVSVRDCGCLGLCRIGIVGCLVGDVCEGGRRDFHFCRDI
jgi:hypothetical protein